MPHVYHKDQPGAPTLQYGASATVYFEAFKTILKACLIHGYGGQPAAGWELIEEDARYLILRSGSHSGYICFSLPSTSNAIVTVSLCAHYLGAGVAGGIIVGEGAVSGTSLNNGSPQKLQIRDIVRADNACSWALFADNKTCILFTACNAVSSSPGELTGSGGGSFHYGTAPVYFGEDSNGNFICCGGFNTSATGQTDVRVSFSNEGFTSLKYPDTGLLVDIGRIQLSVVGLYNTEAQFDQNSTPMPSVYLCPLSWVSGGVYGSLRGICTDPRIIHSFTHYGAAALGWGGGTLTSRTFNALIDLGDGYAYIGCPKGAHQRVIFFLGTNNPEFW